MKETEEIEIVNVTETRTNYRFYHSCFNSRHGRSAATAPFCTDPSCLRSVSVFGAQADVWELVPAANERRVRGAKTSPKGPSYANDWQTEDEFIHNYSSRLLSWSLGLQAKPKHGNFLSQLDWITHGHQIFHSPQDFHREGVGGTRRSNTVITMMC